MDRSYVPAKSILDDTLRAMKKAGVIHPKAKFRRDADAGLRCEATIGDIDFKQFLQRTRLDKEIVDGAIAYLKAEGIVSPSSTYSKAGFTRLHRTVKKDFKGSWSSLSPQMERLLFALTSVKRPTAMYEFGCFWGNTLAWFCGPALTGAFRRPPSIGACDIDRKSVRLARRNFSRAFPDSKVVIQCRDAMDVIDDMLTPLDMIYIEAKAPGRKAVYREIAEKVYDKLAPGAWAIAHDTERYTMYEELASYLEFVRDKGRFAESISFDIDQFGLELSIKRP